MSIVIYVFDIDGTICSATDGRKDYRDALPFEERIDKVNSLYEVGHTIIYYTARGMGRTHNNVLEAYKLFYSFTKTQLKEWGANHHDLFMGKPSAGIYVDEKGMKDEQFFTD